MKFRKGFVSNSSSSSFVCDYCGEVESGFDCSLGDFEMSSCEHGHYFHDCEAELNFLEDATREEKYEALKKHYTYRDEEYYTKLEYDFVNMEDDEFDDEYEEDLMELTWDDGVPEKYCPVCQKLKEVEKDPEWKEYLRLKQKFKDIFVGA